MLILLWSTVNLLMYTILIRPPTHQARDLRVPSLRRHERPARTALRPHPTHAPTTSFVRERRERREHPVVDQETTGYLPQTAPPPRRSSVQPNSMVVDGSNLGDHEIVVSFDDGPNNRTTPILLDTLKRHGVQATFFQVGVNVNNPVLTRRIVDEGHIIGSHTDHHVHLTHSKDVLADISQVKRTLEQYLGETPHLLRPPYGETNAAVSKVLKENDYLIMKWNVDSVDWTMTTPEQVLAKVQRLLGGRTRGALLLMHEYTWTTEAAEKILPAIKAMGFTFKHPVHLFSTEQQEWLWKVSKCPNARHMWCPHLKRVLDKEKDNDNDNDNALQDEQLSMVSPYARVMPKKSKSTFPLPSTDCRRRLQYSFHGDRGQGIGQLMNGVAFAYYIAIRSNRSLTLDITIAGHPLESVQGPIRWTCPRTPSRGRYIAVWNFGRTDPPEQVIPMVLSDDATVTLTGNTIKEGLLQFHGHALWGSPETFSTQYTIAMYRRHVWNTLTGEVPIVSHVVHLRVGDGFHDKRRILQLCGTVKKCIQTALKCMENTPIQQPCVIHVISDNADAKQFAQHWTGRCTIDVSKAPARHSVYHLSLDETIETWKDVIRLRGALKVVYTQSGFSEAAVETHLVGRKAFRLEEEIESGRMCQGPRTLLRKQTTYPYARVMADQSMFVWTGDIGDMWIRDSAAQVWPYLRTDKALVEGTLKRQAMYIDVDPYANSYREKKQHFPDDKRLGRGGYVATRNFELDSGCYFVRLLYAYHQWNPDYNIEPYRPTVQRLVSLWKTEQHHEEQSPYRYVELPRQGLGSKNVYTGMVWSGFRPSDDPCTYGYHIPDNLFLVTVLDYVQSMFPEIDLGTLQEDVRTGIERYGTWTDEEGIERYCYEVDGLGGCNQMDDANVPSLLSIPYVTKTVNERIYHNTREWILSTSNPFYFVGNAGHGIGSPHTPKNHIWPMSILMEGLSAPPFTWDCTDLYKRSSYQSHHRSDVAVAMETPETSIERRESFIDIFEHKTWYSEKTTGILQRSGEGSLWERTVQARAALDVVIPWLKHRLGKTLLQMLDAPCGDMQWMSRYLRTRDDIQYTCHEIVPHNIQHHQRVYANESWTFLERDLVTNVPKRYDLILSRQTTQHLTITDVQQVFAHFRASKSSYLLTTTFPETPTNVPLPMNKKWRFRPLNLEANPFQFTPPICATVDHTVSWLGLWALETPLSRVQRTTAGTGRMHESFHKDDPSRSTRKDFAWADALYHELMSE